MTLLMLLLPTQLGKHFFPSFSFLNGVRVDFLSPTFYLTDLIVIVLAVLNAPSLRKAFTVKRMLIYMSFITVNVILSRSPLISLYKALKLVEFIVVLIISRETAAKFKPGRVIGLFLLPALLVLGLSVAHISLGRSLQGVFYFLGERLVTLSTPGIAKATIDGREILRPYATFSHPNSMAGFYLALYFLFTADSRFAAPRLSRYLVLTVSAAIILVSFSKAAIVTLIALNAIYYIWGTTIPCRICRAARILLPAAVSFSFIGALTDPMSLGKRLELVRDSIRIIAGRPLQGVGLGAYLVAQSEYISRYYLFFNQPVHNIFLLFTAEAGLIVAALTAVYTLPFLRVVWRRNRYVLLAILATGAVDHYWLTLQQNFLLAAFVMGVSAVAASPGRSAKSAGKGVRPDPAEGSL